MLQKKIHGKDLVYFDSAATSLKPQTVIDSISQFYGENYGTVHRAVYTLSLESTALYADVRKQVQQFLKAAHEEEIIFTKGTTEAINLVAASFGKAFLKPGDEVIISEMEHHANIVPWQLICEEKGVLLKVIPVTEKGDLDLEAYRNLLSIRTKIVGIVHVSNALGTINPIKEIIRMAHKWGAKVLVDGAQSAAHMPINVQDLDADFFVFSGHKVFGPTGVGVLYGKKSLLEQMPPYQGGGDMIAHVSFEKTTYQALPLKFEAGTPMISSVIGLGRALSYIESIGKENIMRYEEELLVYATQKLKQIPDLKIIGESEQKGPIISFVIPGIHHLDIGVLLDLQGIAIRTGHHCAQPLMQRFKVPGTVRLSFAPYNTFEEIDYFTDKLMKIKNPT
jgi:cysteine desulfurase/selenocysteine lyase